MIGLLEIGAPADEYSLEAGMIAEGISRLDSVAIIAEKIAGVFNEMFDEEVSSSEYMDLAKKIKKELVEQKIKTDKYYCTRCGAILEEQDGFDPEVSSWVCKKCGQQLIGENLKNDVFDDVVWYCDGCGALLNRQPGFTEQHGFWKCSECGFDNDVTEDNIDDVGLFN